VLSTETEEATQPVEVRPELEAEAEQAPSAEAEPAPEAEPDLSVEADENAAGSSELAPDSYVPVGEPPLGLSGALAVEFGRAIEASWASAEVEQAESLEEPESAEESEAQHDEAQDDDAPELQVRLARVHLRTGALALARVELEKLAGRGSLDHASMLDLAEVRWRTGDLAGAGIAAIAYLDGGGGEALGFVIAAEACAAADRPAEARRYAGRALERSHVGLETYFAGIPRRLTWPQEGGLSAELPTPVLSRQAADIDQAYLLDRADLEAAPEHLEASAAQGEAPTSTPASPTTPTAPDAAATPAESKAPAVEPPAELPAELSPAPAVELTPVEPSPAPAVELTPTEPPTEPSAPTSFTAPAAAQDIAPTQSLERETQTEATVEVDLGIEALQSQDLLMAGLHFGIALRLTPSSATAVLEAIGDRHELPLELVRGDALRLLGHHGAADEAYLSVAAELRAPAKTTSPIGEEAPTEPLPGSLVVAQRADEAPAGEMPAAGDKPALESEPAPALESEPAPALESEPEPAPALESEPTPEPEPAPSGAPQGPSPQERPEPPSIQWD
jgi:hypothetical protein